MGQNPAALVGDLAFITSALGSIDLGNMFASNRARDRAQLGIFMVLVLGAIALVVVSIVLLFGMDIAGQFADGMVTDPDHVYAEEADSTVNATGSAFGLFGTSTLVIPAAAVLAVLIGGLVGAIHMGGSLPGTNGGNGGQIRRRR